MFQAAGSGGELARAAGLQPGRPPCKGSRMRRRAQTEGCIAGWRWKYPARFGRALPRVLRGVRQPAAPGFAARVPYAVGRAFTPAGEACGGGGTAGLCKTPSRKAYESTRPRRRARSPALHCGRKRVATRKWQLSSTPDGGPMQASAPTQGAGGSRESAVAGKGLSPCFAGCMVAGRMRRPGRIFARPGAAPLRRLRRHLPLQGRLLGRQPIDSLPCKGRWMRRKAQTEGALPVGGGDIRQGPAGACPMFRRGRCWHRPANLAAAPGSAAGEIARPTLRAGTGDDAEVAANR